jgi:membrane protein YdbS with pleckstrin-like domain
MIQKSEFEVMTLPAAVMPSCALLGALAMVGAVMAIRWGGWAGWGLGILALLIAVAGLGIAGFLAWGHFAGFPWHFA